MTQKWNLQDIRPVDPRPPRRNGTPLEKPTPGQRQATIEMRPTTPGRPALRRAAETELADTIDDGFDSTPVERVPVTDGRHKARKNLIIAVVIFVSITGLGLFVSHLTGGATITIVPKSRSLTVNAEFTAYKEQRPEELSYEILTLEASGERQVAATGQEEVTTQATGEIEITKTTPGAERLIKNTRFATESGLIFRIEESVVVPGAVTDTTGKSVPGTIRAKVFADEAGDRYNLPANTKLQVPGFKEGNYLDLYNAISATNLTAFTNGFAGPKFIINDQELAAARQSLQTELRDTLLARIETERPAGVTTFPGAVAFTYTELPAVQYGDNLVTIKEQATLQIPMFTNDAFAEYIAKETIVGYDGEGVRINNLSDLTFSYSSATTSQSNLANLDALTFKIAGTPQIVWTFDEGKLKADLLNVQKTAIPQIMASYPGIERSEVEISPIWKRQMPGTMDEITINEDLSTKNE